MEARSKCNQQREKRAGEEARKITRTERRVGKFKGGGPQKTVLSSKGVSYLVLGRMSRSSGLWARVRLPASPSPLPHFINLAAHISELHANSPEAGRPPDGPIWNMTLTHFTTPFRHFTVRVSDKDEWVSGANGANVSTQIFSHFSTLCLDDALALPAAAAAAAPLTRAAIERVQILASRLSATTTHAPTEERITSCERNRPDSGFAARRVSHLSRRRRRRRRAADDALTNFDKKRRGRSKSVSRSATFVTIESRSRESE